MPSFSLRQILVGVVSLAIGFSIWRLPKGSWLDIPLSAASFYFVISLCRHAAATRRALVERPALPRERRWGARLLVVELLSAATALVVASVCTFLAAAEFAFTMPPDVFLDYVGREHLPRDLAALAMLVAIGLGRRQGPPDKPTPARQKVYQAIAVGGTLVVILAYWADRMLIPFLVYVAVSGFEAAQRGGLLPPELNVNAAVRVHRFAIAGFAGLPLAIGNLLLTGGLAKSWARPGWKWTLGFFLCVGLAAECWITCWIAVDGLGQLSPPFHEAIQAPLAITIVVASMLILAVGAFCWRALAKSEPVDGSSVIARRAPFFHESWLAGLVLGVIAIATSLSTFISNVAPPPTLPFAPRTLDFETIVYGLTYRPAQFIWLAAAIGGFGQAWFAWPRRKELLDERLPSIKPALFAAIMASLLIAIVAGAPLLAAACFSYWFVRLGVGF